MARETREVARDIYALTAKRKRARLEVLLKELASALYDDDEPEEQDGELERISDRVKTIADEAFGPFPVQSADDALTAIERGIYELRKACR